MGSQRGKKFERNKSGQLHKKKGTALGGQKERKAEERRGGAMKRWDGIPKRNLYERNAAVIQKTPEKQKGNWGADRYERSGSLKGKKKRLRE